MQNIQTNLRRRRERLLDRIHQVKTSTSGAEKIDCWIMIPMMRMMDLDPYRNRFALSHLDDLQ